MNHTEPYESHTDKVLACSQPGFNTPTLTKAKLLHVLLKLTFSASTGWPR